MPDIQDRYDIFIYVALKEEFDLVYEILSESSENIGHFEIPNMAVTLYSKQLYSDALGRKVRVLLTCADKMGNTNAASVVSGVLGRYVCDQVIVLGIAGTINEDLKLGDIFVPSTVNEYLDNAASTNDPAKVFLTSGNETSTNNAVLNRIQNFSRTRRDDYERLLDRCKASFDKYIDEPAITTLKKAHLDTSGDVNIVASGDLKLASGPVVSKTDVFTQFIRGIDRKHVAVEMESAGVYAACANFNPSPTVISVRGISDFGDERKHLIEECTKNGFRSVAVTNATHFLVASIENGIFFEQRVIDTPRSSEGHVQLNDPWETIKEYNTLSLRYVRDFDDEKIDHIYNYFNTISYYDPNIVLNEDEFVLTEMSYPKLEEELRSGVDMIEIQGNRGVGKTRYLEGLCKYLSKGSGFTSIYFHLHRIIEKYYSNHEALEREVLEYTSAIENLNRDNVVLIFDNVFEGWPIPREVSVAVNIVLEALQQCKKISKLVYSTRLTNQYDPGRRMVGRMLKGRKGIAIFRKFDCQYDSFDELIARFLDMDVSGMKIDKQKFADYIKNLDLRELDLATLSVLLHRWGAGDDNTIDGLLDQFIRHKCKNKKKTYEKSARIFAYQSFNDVSDVSDVNDDGYFNLIDIAGGELIRDYFVVQYLIEKLTSTDNLETEDINCFKTVFDDQRNNIFKSVINKNRTAARDAVNGIVRIESVLRKSFDVECVNLESEIDKISGMTHLCYLAGRINPDGLEIFESARNFLWDSLSFIDKVCEKHPNLLDNRNFRLYRRTVFISLSYMGESKAMHRYLDLLLTDSKEDDLNRGFHLEYYGDIKAGSLRHMVHSDTNATCTRTFDRILSKIRSYISDDRTHDVPPKLIEIETQTLLSLVLHRHHVKYIENYPEEHVILVHKTLDLLNDLESKRTTEFKNVMLRRYIGFVQKQLQLRYYDPIITVNDVNNLAGVIRTGWKKYVDDKNIRLESVAEHSFSVCMMALLTLPDSIPHEEEYDKQGIVMMLLVHDLAEAYIGDIFDKTEGIKRSERGWMEYLSMLGVYSEMPDLSSLLTTFDEFEKGESINARIARDMDIIDSYIKLNKYKEHISDADFNQFVDYVFSHNYTGFGNRLLIKTRDFFKINEGDEINDFQPWPSTLVDYTKL